MKWLKSILALCAFFVLSAGLAACGSGVPGNSVADMAGNPITLGAFNHWIYVEAASNAAQSPGSPLIVPTDPPQFTGCIAQVRRQIPTFAKKSSKELRGDCNQLFTSLSTPVMQFLITSYWYQAEATRQHVKVTNAEVQKAFATDKSQAFPTEAQFQAFLKQSGQTLNDILYRVRINLFYMKLVKKLSKSVTPAQIRAYYNSHLSQFGTPQTRNIRIVLTKTLADANAAKNALTHGATWKATAKKYSTDPTTKNNGGLLVSVKKGQEDAALDKAAFAAPQQKLLGPIKGQFGYYIFKVTTITKGNQQTLAQATPIIQQQLVGQQQSSAQSSVDAQARKHWLSKTKCRKAYAMSYCSGHKPPKAPTTSTR